MRIHILKRVTLMTAVLFLLFAGAGLAEGPLLFLYSAGEKILMETANVTLMGEAEFYLDENMFKTAKGLYIQDGTDSFQQIDLSGKDTEGKERKTGYAVLDLEGEVTSSEVYHGIDHRFQRSRAPESTILPSTRNVLTLMKLGRAAAEVLEQSSSAEIRTILDANGKRIILKFGEPAEIPPVVQSALNLLWQEGVTRYFFSSYRDLFPETAAAVKDYGTPTQGILFTTREITLHDLNMETVLDEADRIVSLKGDAAFLLQGAADGTHDLKVLFSLKAEAYDESKVRDNQAVYGRMGNEENEGKDTTPAMTVFQSHMTQRTVEDDEEAIHYAQEIWQMDYLAAGDLSGLTWAVRPMENGHISVRGYDPGDVPSHCYMVETDETGWVYSLRNTVSEVDQAVEYWPEEMDSPVWDNYRHKLIDMSLDFAEALNPQDTERIEAIREENLFGAGVNGVYVPGYGGASIYEGKQFLSFYGNPDYENNRRTKIVFQIEPVFRVVLFNQLKDALEGGNG